MTGSIDFVYPNYQGDSILSVMPRVASALGVETNRPVRDPNDSFPRADRVVVVLCDGLGWHNLETRKAHTPFLRQRQASMSKLTSTFPSTTAAAIPSIGTGTPPGQTGFVGYTVRNPHDGGLVNLVPWTENLDPTIVATPVGNSQAPKFSMDPQVFQRQPQVFHQLIQSGVEVTCVGSAKYAGTGLSQAAFGKTKYAVAEAPGERVSVVLRLLKNNPSPQVIYLYWGEVDKAGHRYGPDSEEWIEALTDFDGELSRLVKGAPTGTLVVMTADHGQITTNSADQVDVAQVPDLANGVALIAGEARAVHVHLKAEGDTIEAAIRWQSVLEDKAQVWTKKQAIELGVFGPVLPSVRPWIGDLVVAAKGNATIVDSRTQTANSLMLAGVHGSLTPKEMEVPLLVELT